MRNLYVCIYIYNMSATIRGCKTQQPLLTDPGVYNSSNMWHSCAFWTVWWFAADWLGPWNNHCKKHFKFEGEISSDWRTTYQSAHMYVNLSTSISIILGRGGESLGWGRVQALVSTCVPLSRHSDCHCFKYYVFFLCGHMYIYIYINIYIHTYIYIYIYSVQYNQQPFLGGEIDTVFSLSIFMAETSISKCIVWIFHCVLCMRPLFERGFIETANPQACFHNGTWKHIHR